MGKNGKRLEEVHPEEYACPFRTRHQVTNSVQELNSDLRKRTQVFVLSGPQGSRAEWGN